MSEKRYNLIIRRTNGNDINITSYDNEDIPMIVIENITHNSNINSLIDMCLGSRVDGDVVCNVIYNDKIGDVTIKAVSKR